MTQGMDGIIFVFFAHGGCELIYRSAKTFESDVWYGPLSRMSGGKLPPEILGIKGQQETRGYTITPPVIPQKEMIDLEMKREDG